MRKRYSVAFLAAVALAASGGYVWAESGDRPGATAATVPHIVTLPTGDKLRVVGDGALAPLPGESGFGFHAPRLPDGDRIAVPFSALKQVRSGELDPRLFNVDALLRNGYSDARKVTEPERLGKSFLDGEVSASSKADTEVTVSYTWLDGSVPEEAGGFWLNMDTGDYDYFGADEGVANLTLPPGDYSFVADMGRYDGDDYSDVVGTVADLTVTDTAAELTVDGRRAEPVGFEVDNPDVAPSLTELEFFAALADDDVSVSSGYVAEPSTKLYAIPSAEPTGHRAGFTVRGELSTDADAAEAVSYSLFAVEESGIPAEPAVTVHDADLAAREAVYNDTGAEATLERSNLSYHADYPPVSYLPAGSVAVPSQRTEFYTADAAVDWAQTGTFADPDDEERFDDVLHHSGVMEPGSEAMPWLSGGAVSVGVSDPAFPYYGSGIERWAHSGAPELLARPPMFDTAADETIVSSGLDGKAVIRKGDTELGSSTDGTAVVAELDATDEGRYTASLDATRDAAWLPMGTRSTATWEFDSKPVDEDTPLGVSVVAFTAADVEAGYAPVDRPQPVELDFTTQPGAADRSCAELTFQVSYDDGETWTDVDVDREGDHATATLEHPADASFVSVRFTATDDLGQTVEHATIRSYGLK